MSVGIVQEYIKDCFIYQEGKLIWNPNCTVKRIPKRLVGLEAGTINKSRGYRYIKLDGKLYLAHRLIYLYHYGYLPTEIDHINRDKLDNRIENLRDATRELNTQNTAVRADSTSGLKNIRQLPSGWQVRLQFNKKEYSKVLPNKEEAIAYRDNLLETLRKDSGVLNV